MVGNLAEIRRQLETAMKELQTQFQSVPATTAATPSGSSAVTGTSVDPATAGAGYVQIDVQLTSSGVSETISLDRLMGMTTFQPACQSLGRQKNSGELLGQPIAHKTRNLLP